MQPSEGTHPIQAGWSTFLARATGAILLFEVLSGLAITFGPFHPAVQWGLLLHTILGLATLAPLAWYFARHWKDYAGQALNDVLLLGYVGLGALAICEISGLWLTGQALFGIRTSAWLRYIHLISTLLTLAATIPHLVIAWWRRRNAEFAKGARGWTGVTVVATVAGIAVVGILTFAYAGTKYHNAFPSDYSYLFGKDRPFAPSLAHTATNSAYDPRSLAGSETCGSSGCHTEIYREWQSSAHGDDSLTRFHRPLCPKRTCRTHPI